SGDCKTPGTILDSLSAALVDFKRHLFSSIDVSYLAVHEPNFCCTGGDEIIDIYIIIAVLLLTIMAFWHVFCYSFAHSGGCSSMVEQKLPKLTTRVRFPSPAPFFFGEASSIFSRA